MTTAWNPPRRLPVLFDIPDTPPPRRITIATGMSPLRLGLAVIRSGGPHAAGGCLLLVLFNTASTLVPLALGAAVDHGIGPVTAGEPVGEVIGRLLGWAAVIAGLFVVINLTYRFGGRMGWYAVQRASFELSSRVLERILDVRGTAGPPQLPGRLLSVATSDSDRTSSALYFAIYPLGNIVGIVLAVVSLSIVHPVLGLAVGIGAPVLLAVLAVVARPLRARLEREQHVIADLSGAAADLVGGHRVLAGIQAQAAATGLYRTRSRIALRSSLAADTAGAALVGTTAAITGLFAGGIAVTAAVLAFDGSISVGALIAAAALAQLILTPLRELVEVAATVGADVLASARRVLDLLHGAHDPQSSGADPLPEVPRLRLSSPALDDPVDVTPGELVAIDLPAADAETLIAAMTLTSTSQPVRHRTAEVTVDGRPLREHDPELVRATILVAPHHTDLLEPTVLANVRTGGHDERARAALRVARCESLEDELPQGYDTPIGGSGRTLSGGQRQRIGLARAVARDAPVLVLHDPTSSVDAVTELDIARRLRLARATRTTVVLTSSPAFHAVADRQVVARRPESTDDHR